MTGSLFAFAGLWDRWRDPSGNWIKTCSILTTAPNAVTSAVHDRMPVILDPDISAGNGNPEGVVTSVAGGLYLRLDGGAQSALYVKESGTGNTGWVAK